MTDPIDENEEEAARRKKKKDEGEGDSDSWGRGKAGAVSGVRHLPPQKLKEVMADWRHLDIATVLQAVADFFSELPMRASANLSVLFDKSKGFALVNWIISFGEKAAHNLDMTREKAAGRDSRTLQNKREQKARPGVDMNPKPNGM